MWVFHNLHCDGAAKEISVSDLEPKVTAGLDNLISHNLGKKQL